MDEPRQNRLAESLRERQTAIAEAWYAAIVRTSFVSLSSTELRQRLYALTGRAIELLLAGALEPEDATPIGTALAGLHLTQPEALGRTQSLLAIELLRGLAPEAIVALHPRLAALLEGVAIGFGRENTRILLYEQEAVRKALVSDLRAAERGVRQARDHLEEKVAERTEDLRASEEKYRRLLEELNAAVVAVDQEGTVTYASPSITRLFGWQPAEAVGKPFHEFIFAPDRPGVLELLARAGEGGSTTCEFRVSTSTNELRWVHDSTRLILKDGRFVAAHGVLVDITQRKQVEEAVKESEERWHALVTNAPDSVLTLDAAGRVLFVNHLPSESGLTSQSLTGQSIVDIVVPEHRQVVREALRQVFSGGVNAVYESAVRRPSGALIWYSAHVAPLWRGDRVASALMIARNITERRESEEKLRLSEERWHALVSNAPDIIYSVDREGRLLYVNRIPPGSSFQAAGVLGLSVCDLVVPEHRRVVEEALARVFSAGLSARYEAAVRRPGGAVVWYSTHLGPLWREGKVEAALVIARDVTERKRTEQMKDNLLRDVSHELRSPLARAQMSLELALERLEQHPVDGQGAAKYGRMALENVERLAGNVAAILDLSRLEGGAGAFAREAIQVDELIATLVAGMQPFASEKGLVLVANASEPLPPVRGDRENLARVLRNLIDNALKFSSAGQVVVSATRKPGRIQVSVGDKGCGILPENLERVFDRFFKEETGVPGVGVGLPMCKTIIEAHGGRIWAESAGRGKGATFRFVLPIPSRDQTAEAD